MLVMAGSEIAVEAHNTIFPLSYTMNVKRNVLTSVPMA